MLKHISLFIVYATWCLPQTLLGLIVFCVLRIFRGVSRFCNYGMSHGSGMYSDVIIVHTKRFCGASLGMFIFYADQGDLMKNVETLNHEYGHTIQGFIWGPLYLLVIGMPSLINNIRSRFDSNFAKRYYMVWPERQADKFGGVNRGHA